VTVRRLADGLRWPLLLMSALFTALFLAWQTLVAVDFLYPAWHQALDIGDTVREFGPQNKHRHGFERTTAEEHARLFAAIVRAVEDGGLGLENLKYRDRDGATIDQLLTPPEMVHLRDVARLVRLFERFGWVCLLMFVAVTASLWFWPAPRPAVKKYLAYFGVSVLVVVGVILAIGAKDVFYKLHTWIFPAGHQWFFFYQDSLMTTLMQAPVLFAGIAAEWLMLTVVVFLLLITICGKLLPREEVNRVRA